MPANNRPVANNRLDNSYLCTNIDQNRSRSLHVKAQQTNNQTSFSIYFISYIRNMSKVNSNIAIDSRVN